jgi:integrase
MHAVRAKLYRGWYYAVWRQPGAGTQRRALRTKDRAAAERLITDLKSAPVGELVSDIFDAYQRDKQEKASHQRMLDAWKALKTVFGHLRPDQISRELCRSYITKRRALGRGNGTIGKELSVLRSALRWHDRQTPAVIELPPKPAPRERHLGRTEFAKLLEKADAFHVQLFIVLALSTAARATAILELTWDRVDLARGIIKLATGSDGEGRKGRATVPITETAKPWLEKAKEAAMTDFVIEWGGKPVKSIKKGFGRAAQRAGLDDVSPHVLRHTAAVWMAENGVSMDQIAQYLGHSDSRITERVYARFSPTYLRTAASALIF